ncbi:glycosyltransferase family 4 protein [Pantoea sp. 1.19]|uniref:glycosyltransferase family 4 protein n=1 Tax=Pantoea sp. 1.19 TaxID=1925589 RepID=UPI000948A60C|nr:glycosyltransferase family 4 protein [Pantoea sp. 1.19]
MRKKKIKVGLIVDEFFGAVNTRFGGYGYLARYYISRYLPNDEFEFEVLLGKGRSHFFSEEYRVDGLTLYKLPRRDAFARRWLKRQHYDLYFSVELTHDHVLRNEPRRDVPLVLWIQDPRPQYEWAEIFTMTHHPETSYYNQKIYDWVHEWYRQGRVTFVSQARCLNAKAIDLYRLRPDTEIAYLPNPIDIDEQFDVARWPKKNAVVFLGRIASVKRGWIFCEIAKAMPEYEFYVLGKVFRADDKNHQLSAEYAHLPNLHFTGHVEGEAKNRYLRDAKVLVNSSIHEALPVSFLEALSWGTLLVSNRNPDELTSRFGIHVGEVQGNGFDAVPRFVEAIRQLIEDEPRRQRLAAEGVAWVKAVHNNADFIANSHRILRSALPDATRQRRA